MARIIVSSLLAISLLAGSLPAQVVRRVADINPGPGGGGAGGLTVFQGSLYFTANDLPHGSDVELWRYDGTGVERAADIRPGSDGSSPWDLTVLGDTLYMAARGPTGPARLWQFDGDTAMQVPTAPASDQPQLDSFSELTVFDSKLFYRATLFGTYGTELWKSDGTDQDVIDLVPGTGHSGPKEFVEYNGSLYMNSRQQLWKLNAMATGATQMTNEPGSFSPESPAVFDGAIYFRAYDAAHGYELWRYQDGTNDAQRVSDIAPGTAFSSPSGMTVFRDKLYFSADDGVTGSELYSYDATNGAVLVHNINQTPPPTGGEDPEHHANPSEFFVFNDLLYFAADDGVHGRELWKYDGAGVPQLVADIYPGQYGSSVGGFAVYQDQLFFSANDGTLGGELSQLDDNALFALAVPEPSGLVLVALAGITLIALYRRSMFQP